MTTALDVVTSYAHRWRSLAAWRAPLAVIVTVRPMPAHHTRRLGTAWPCQRRATVYATGDLATDLPTVLHELAHLAAPNYAHHEAPWREIYLAAAAEALGCDVSMFEADVSLSDLRAQVTAAVDGWLTTSGQRAVLQAIGVMPAPGRR